MKRYLVGGAVRDQLLGREAKDLDWLVIETTPAALIELGYRKVGKAFSTYLHPTTSEEHSFPRGPKDSAGTRSAIIADLTRRDLTINAMAIGPDNELVDPLGGKKDLEGHTLRHTPAFTEDPLRIVRTARLIVDLSAYGFSIAPETVELMASEVAAGALNQLPKERIWSEVERALAGADPALFFKSLRQCGALRVLMPELEELFGVPQPIEHHPEIDCGEHALLSLTSASKLSPMPIVRFAALIHDLGKGLTPHTLWPRHIGHEPAGRPLVQKLCQRLGAPKNFRILAEQVSQYHTKTHQCLTLRPGTLLRLLQHVDCFRKPERFDLFLLACEADATGRKGYENSEYPQRQYLKSLANATCKIDLAALNLAEMTTEQRIELVNRARLETISKEKKRLVQLLGSDIIDMMRQK